MAAASEIAEGKVFRCSGSADLLRRTKPSYRVRLLRYVGILIKTSLGVDDRSVMLCLVSRSGQSVRVPIKKTALAELTDTTSALTATISRIYELQQLHTAGQGE